MAIAHALRTPAHDQFRSGPPPVGRSRRLRSGLLVGATSVALTFAVLPDAAVAEPGAATTPEQAAQLVADASHELGVVTEELNTARVQLEEREAAVAAAEQAAADAREQLASLDGQIRQLARAAYTGEGLTEFDLLLTSDSAEDFLSQLGTLEAIAGHTNDLVTQVAAASQAADTAQAAADDAAAQAQRAYDEVAAKQADLESQVADYQRQYADLTAEQQQQVLDAEAGPTQAVPTSVAATSAAAQIAVDTALAQVGDPYVWGAAGPDSFDCSGLTMYAYAAAGIALPHSSRMQATMGRAVSVAELQPGDLLFFYSPISHESMYIGNGMMVHAATSGTPVKVVALDSMIGDLVAARRLVG